MRAITGQRLGGSGGGASSPLGIRLIQPGALASGGVITHTRSQAGGATSTAPLDTTGTWQTYAADTPRFRLAAQRLLVEPQRTNGVRNPRMDGTPATPGIVLDPSGNPGSGAPPSFTSSGFPFISDDGGAAIGATGLTWEITSNAWPGVGGGNALVMRIYGTATATFGRIHINLDNRTLISFGSFSTLYAAGIESMLIAGSTANFTTPPRYGTGRYSNIGGLQGSDYVSTPLSLTSTPTRVTLTHTTTATTQRLHPSIIVGFNSGAVIDITFAVRWPHTEQSTVATTPVLPAVNTPDGSRTRGADFLSSALTTIAPTGVWTFVASLVLFANAPTGVNQTIINIDDGTLNNRFRLRNAAGSADIIAGNVIAGTPSDAPTLGTHTAGTLFRVGMTWDGTTLVANLNGGTNQSVTGSPGALTTARYGNSSANDAPMIGEFAYIDVYPFATPPAQLPALVSAIPG